MLNKQLNNPSNFVIYILLWTGINLFFLTIFPFMHTDESWLAGLSRAMLVQKNPTVTEPFFSLITRAPHAIKILFHGLQIIFIRLFGYSLFSIRLLQLLTGAAVLTVFGKLLSRLSLPSFPAVIMLSAQIQFIYASHFGRQEIQVLLFMLLSLYFLVAPWDGEERPSNSEFPCFRRGLLAGLPIAFAIGFHPNAFIAAWPAGLVLLFDIVRKKRKLSEGFGFLILPAASALIFVLLSLSFNNNFVSAYGSFGGKVGVLEPFDIKLLGFDDFYRKLFLQVSGTYFTPRIWPVFVLAAAGLIRLAVCSIVKRSAPSTPARLAAAGLIGVNAGILIIGKYSAPSVIFVIPFLIILIAAAVKTVPRPAVRKIIYSAVIILLTLNSISVIFDETSGKENFSDFTAQIKTAIPPLPDGLEAPDSRVLGPLTAEFALEHGRLLDWRNLTVLREAGFSLEKWLRQSSVEYIIYTEELDVIYKNRPVWNLLYGNPTVYHEQLQTFLAENCELVLEFSSPGYGTRIVFHRFTHNSQVRVYRVR